jgi:hypothetical protein
VHPEELGYYEARPGSGIWSHPDRRNSKYEPRICENPACGKDFMAERRPNRPPRFCSQACWGQHERKPDAGYGPLHERVLKARGRASEQPCVDCDGQARHWSQKHGTTGQDPYDYEPRCVTCHYGTAGYDDEARARGEAHSNAKLTEEQVRGIRTSTATQRELARIHGVSQSAISYVRQRKTWKVVA